MAERTAAFMEKSRGAGKPFFAQLSCNALHATQNARKETWAKYGYSRQADRHAGDHRGSQ